MWDVICDMCGGNPQIEQWLLFANFTISYVYFHPTSGGIKLRLECCWQIADLLEAKFWFVVSGDKSNTDLTSPVIRNRHQLWRIFSPRHTKQNDQARIPHRARFQTFPQSIFLGSYESKFVNLLGFSLWFTFLSSIIRYCNYVYCSSSSVYSAGAPSIACLSALEVKWKNSLSAQTTVVS